MAAGGGLLADRHRGWGIPALLALLLGVSAAYARHAARAPRGWAWCMEDPIGRDGAPLVLPLWTVTGVDGGGRYRISKHVRDLPVAGDTAGLAVGDTVSVVARFDGVARVAREERREVHRLRRWKEALGLLGVLCGVAAAPFAFRWDRRARRLEERWRTW